ncbi:hypothetical protein BGW36DRAFT_174890 [Talaromyces proteolyticus]|uniref:Uncharacterized protein n=1 Tax=Talaromyces proteolyticus TaxID=1131652 RepID=A0AAD4KT75_9EURO|nr:uncharacterized protein BGW36DRAFT_174890 [Talaromyces proteolyticus]KAH8697767.1 hypothetical protein BGW36DRAFT_174890 [Talaromyces proteolyticus]
MAASSQKKDTNSTPLFRSNFASAPSSTQSAIPPSLSKTSSSLLSATDHKTSSSSTSSFSTIQYDHETYLELLAGKSSSVEKTASQIYREERARQLSLRAQDPAVLSGPMDLDDFATHHHTGGYYGENETRK